MEQLEIKKVSFTQKLAAKKRVCAYARVSSGKDAMLHSLSCQISYYSEMIQKRADWLYCGVFADEAISGTKNNREQFNKMVALAKQGEIDLIITKSISRFARNTVTLLETIRELKEYGVDVYFEEQNIHTLSAEGEVMLTILASYAQEEAISVGQNMRWRIRKNFEEGKVYSLKVLGYDLIDGELIINKKEAKIVKLIYRLYLEGNGFTHIAAELNRMGYKTKIGTDFKPGGVSKTLRNILYTGDLLLQKTFRAPLTKVTVQNRGQMSQFKVEGAHEGIIDKETFNKVQTEIQKRKAEFATENTHIGLFSNLIVCDCCKRHLVRSTCNVNPTWICSLYKTRGKKACDSQAVPEAELIRICKELLNTEELSISLLNKEIKQITAKKEQKLIFELPSGEIIEKQWRVRSRSESWSEEKRRQMSESKKGKYYGKKDNDNSSNQQ